MELSRVLRQSFTHLLCIFGIGLNVVGQIKRPIGVCEGPRRNLPNGPEPTVFPQERIAYKMGNPSRHTLTHSQYKHFVSPGQGQKLFRPGGSRTHDLRLIRTPHLPGMLPARSLSCDEFNAKFTFHAGMGAG